MERSDEMRRYPKLPICTGGGEGLQLSLLLDDVWFPAKSAPTDFDAFNTTGNKAHSVAEIPAVSSMSVSCAVQLENSNEEVNVKMVVIDKFSAFSTRNRNPTRGETAFFSIKGHRS